MALTLPNVNGAAGIVLKGIVAFVTGPAKLAKLTEDIAETKADVKALDAKVDGIAGDVRETKGLWQGYLAGRKDAEN